jgi:hypothetical protein
MGGIGMQVIGQWSYSLRIHLSESVQTNAHRNPVQQDKPITPLAWIMSQRVQSSIPVLLTGARSVDWHHLPDFLPGV